MSTPTDAMSTPSDAPTDAQRRRALRRMKNIALGALVFLAIVFAFSFAAQEQVPALAYVRAAAEGGMVGALADWFAVTALFRRPLGLPIPHTAIIPTRKDEIGRTLGTFVETEFLAGDVVRRRLQTTPMAARAGAWLAQTPNAERVAAEASALAGALLRALDDDDVRDVIEALAREHALDPQWGPPLGERLERLVGAGAHTGAVDLAADTLGTWLDANRQAFEGVVSRRLPGWVPRVAHRVIDEALHREALAFVRAVRADPRHPARLALDGYLLRLARNLQHDTATIDRLERAKEDVFDSPRVRELAGDVWGAAKNGMLTALADENSAVRVRMRRIVAEVGERLTTDDRLQRRVDGWLTDAAVFVVERYRHDIASIITDTVERWDPAETSEKIELMVGRDLQYIRLNGTVVGSIAGLAIFALAEGISSGLA